MIHQQERGTASRARIKNRYPTVSIIPLFDVRNDSNVFLSRVSYTRSNPLGIFSLGKGCCGTRMHTRICMTSAQGKG